MLSDTATVLEDIIAFEERARDLHTRWNDVRIASTAEGTASPFLTPGGEALAADLRTLKADLPRHAVMLSSLQQVLAELDRHEARIAERGQGGSAGRASPCRLSRLPRTDRGHGDAALQDQSLVPRDAESH